MKREVTLDELIELVGTHLRLFNSNSDICHRTNFESAHYQPKISMCHLL
jgi:hypothetical protein